MKGVKYKFTTSCCIFALRGIMRERHNISKYFLYFFHNFPTHLFQWPTNVTQTFQGQVSETGSEDLFQQKYSIHEYIQNFQVQ